MSRITSAIRSDLRRILLETPGLPDADGIKWEGRTFTPTVGVAYVAERLDPVASTPATLGLHGSVEERFVYAIDVFMPATGALTGGDDLADAIRQTFHVARGIGSVDPVVMQGRVISSERGLPLESDGWKLYPVRVTLFVRRPTFMAA